MVAEMNMESGEDKKRLLAAIMFTDMVGYTALMQENEQLAKRNRDKHRKIQKETTEEFDGEILQYYGDGTLIIFKSAVQAVQCGVKIQQLLQEEPKVPLRIGIHSGDIVYDDEGIYGDGVNIASRIENIAEAGSILVSDKVADELKNHPEPKTKKIGSFQLKNVKHDVIVHAVIAEKLAVPDSLKRVSKSDTEYTSIAVLPFVSMSSDPENEYFSDGITEELLNALTKIEGLQVTARTSSFAFKQKNIDIREIGNQLGVKTVLEGSVRKAGNKVRITAQLINVADGYHIWSETFNRQLEDIFELQDEISLRIANKLRKNLAKRPDKERLVTPATTNIDAYNLYLKALHYQNKWNFKDSETAIDLLKKAITMDSEFALAYAQLAMIYGFLGASRKIPPSIAYPKAKEFAFTANNIDPTLPESHLAFANYNFWMEFNWKVALHHINEAIKLNPSLTDAYMFKGIFLTVFNRIKEAKVCIQLALQLDPLSIPSRLIYSHILYWMGKSEESEQQLDDILDLAPECFDAYQVKAMLALERNQYDKVQEYMGKIKKEPNIDIEYTWALGMLKIKQNNLDKGKQYLYELLEISKDPDQAVHFQIGSLFGMMGEMDKMAFHFNKSIDNKESDIIFIDRYKIHHPFREDPRYKAVLKRLNLPIELS